jgi:hypothetical protein
MSEADFQMTREDFQVLLDKFRILKHDINNTLAVVMALSELGQRNPAHFEKLAAETIRRGPDVVQGLQEFQNALQNKLKAPGAAEPGNGSFPSSGVF